LKVQISEIYEIEIMDNRRNIAEKVSEISTPREAPPAMRKSYEVPRLIAWGSVADLTLGGKFGEEDMDFSGTQGT
jgi:hypothetical protein